MRNGRTFPYRPRRVDPCGDGEGQASGVLDAPVKAGRPRRSEARAAPKAETRDEAPGAKMPHPCPLEKPRGRAPRAPVPKPTQVGG